jgi:hypothetical protein
MISTASLTLSYLVKVLLLIWIYIKQANYSRDLVPEMDMYLNSTKVFTRKWKDKDLNYYFKFKDLFNEKDNNIVDKNYN